MNPEFTATLRSVDDAATAPALIRGEDTQSTERSASPASTEDSAAASGGTASSEEPGAAEPFRIVAVTSCPTGIAHTCMTAESPANAGRDAGDVEIVVETQGSAGFTRFDPAVIAAADGVIFAHDLPVREKERFAGKPTVDVGVKAGINRPGELIPEVRAKAARGEVTAAAKGGTPVQRAGEPGDSYGTKLRKWLMSGVSYMVPFVAAGGLLIASASRSAATRSTAPSRSRNTSPGARSTAGARSPSRSVPWPSGSWSRCWLATSRTAWRTGQASSPASSAA